MRTHSNHQLDFYKSFLPLPPIHSQAKAYYISKFIIKILHVHILFHHQSHCLEDPSFLD